MLKLRKKEMNSQIKALDESYELYNDVILEYGTQNNVSNVEIDNLLKALKDAYREKKASYYFEHKLSAFDSFIEIATDFALDAKSEKNTFSNYNILYIKELKELTSNG